MTIYKTLRIPITIVEMIDVLIEELDYTSRTDYIKYNVRKDYDLLINKLKEEVKQDDKNKT